MHLATTPASLATEDWCLLGQRTEGFSGSDLSNCTSDAMFEPVRELENTTHWKLTEGNRNIVDHIKFQNWAQLSLCKVEFIEYRISINFVSVV